MHNQLKYNDRNKKGVQELFHNNCESCHPLRGENPMRGVLSRIPSLDWAFDFVRDENSLLAKGDGYAIELRKKYHQIQSNHQFARLSNDEIESILQYVDVGY